MLIDRDVHGAEEYAFTSLELCSRISLVVQVYKTCHRRPSSKQGRHVTACHHQSISEDWSVILIYTHTQELIFFWLDYAGKQAHVELAERMKQRDAG